MRVLFENLENGSQTLYIGAAYMRPTPDNPSVEINGEKVNATSVNGWIEIKRPPKVIEALVFEGIDIPIGRIDLSTRPKTKPGEHDTLWEYAHWYVYKKIERPSKVLFFYAPRFFNNKFIGHG